VLPVVAASAETTRKAARAALRLQGEVAVVVAEIQMVPHSAEAALEATATIAPRAVPVAVAQVVMREKSSPHQAALTTIPSEQAVLWVLPATLVPTVAPAA
jgi:hypothetical protein